jgi:hypothetical protein
MAAGLVATLAAASPGCGSLLGDDPTTFVRPALEILDIDGFESRLTGGGFLMVYALAEERSLTLGPRERIPITVTTTSGDFEQVGIYHVYCPPGRRRAGGFDCFRFLIRMQDQNDITEIAPYVAAIGGRFVTISPTGKWATIVLFEPVNIIRQARAAATWPGVADTDVASAPCFASVCTNLYVPIRIDAGTPEPGDGTIQVQPRDTVRVRYQQPETGSLEDFAVVP